MKSVICDISGTHSRVAIVDNKKILNIRDYLTKDITSIKDLLSMYLYLEKFESENIVLSIAGKITRDSGFLNHGDLTISRRELEEIGFKNIFILNDFQALSYGVLDVKDFREVTPLKSSENYLVIGAGTGLGVSLFENGISTNVKKDNFVDSEANFFMELNSREIDLVYFIQKKLQKTSLIHEEILSGVGLETIYEYLAGSLLSAEEISQLDSKSSQETFDIFYSFYLKTILYYVKKYNVSQIFVAGGIIMKNMSYFNQNIEETWVKELENVGCRILLDYDVSLYGLRNVALKKV